MSGAVSAAFVQETRCWICGSMSLRAVHHALFELAIYSRRIPSCLDIAARG